MPFVSVTIQEVQDIVAKTKCEPDASPTPEPSGGVTQVGVYHQSSTIPPSPKHSRDHQAPSHPQRGVSQILIRSTSITTQDPENSDVSPTPEPEAGWSLINIYRQTRDEQPSKKRSKETRVPPPPQRGVSQLLIKAPS